MISEKATVAGILRPVLGEYGVTFFPVHGFNSATKMHDLADQISRGAADGNHQQHFILLYVGDHDPSGMYMSQVDLPERLKRYGANDFEEWIGKSFELERIALTEDDLEDLPSFDAKTEDPRYRWYFEQYGEDAYELDALNPNDLPGERVEEAINEYINLDDWEQHKKIKRLSARPPRR